MQHIEKVIHESQGGIPDFGFNHEFYSDQKVGWGQVVGMMIDINKNERIKNYIEAKQYFT